MNASLPIHELRPRLRDALGRAPRVVIRAPTGSGKSTQIPQMLVDDALCGGGQVVVLQPRRIAARMLAARVARERGGAPGGEVGYQVRFDSVIGPSTRIRYVTEGILLRQMLDRPGLPDVGAVIFDEFHERHLYGDLTLARALDLQAASRPDLKILVMSATLRVEALETYLQPCQVLTSQGRTHPVDIEYLPKPPPESEPVWDTAVRAFEHLAADDAPGDCLIFMPGAYEIQRTISALRDSPAGRGRAVLPLHGELSPADQDAAVAPGDRPKVIVATNVAETSLTIEGVRMVVDAGLARIPRHDPYRGINTLLIERISRASADQRAGRAGRTAPGRCIRLWTEREHAARPAEELPEIRRLDLSEAVLTLKASGVGDLRGVRWLDAPPERALERAETLLRDLGALDDTGTITAVGRRMVAFPMHPRYARMLIAAGDCGAVRPVALMAALTQSRDLLMRRTGHDTEDRRDDLLGGRAPSDFFILMRAWTYAMRSGGNVEACNRLGIRVQSARETAAAFEHFLRIAEGQGLRPAEAAPDDEAVQKCILAGFVDHLAMRLDEGTLRCRLVHGRKGQLDRSSVVRDAPLFVAAEVHEIEGRDIEVRLSLATEVKPDWLRELWPGDFTERVETSFDRLSKRVVAERQVCFRDLPLERKRVEPPPADAAAAILAAGVLKGDLSLPRWNEAVEQWILRVNLLARVAPDLGLAAIGPGDRQTMIEHLCHGAVSAKDLKDRDPWPTVRGWLDPARQTLVERHAPERIELRNGRRGRLTYSAEGPPTMAIKIQDLYDVAETPRIAAGRVPVLVQILGPNFRPVQVTQDLAGFWRDTYPKVRQEFRRKYPKHEWR